MVFFGKIGKNLTVGCAVKLHGASHELCETAVKAICHDYRNHIHPNFPTSATSFKTLLRFIRYEIQGVISS